MARARSVYLAGMSAVMAATATSLVAGLASLWLLNQILTKPMFGAYAVAMNMVFLLAIVATLGLDRTILLRIAGLHGRVRALRGTGLVLRAAAISGTVAIALALGLWGAGGVLLEAGVSPEAVFWLGALGVAIVPVTLAALLQTWFQANHRVSESVILPSLADAGRAVLFAAVLLTGGGTTGVVIAVIVAASFPVAAVLWRARPPRRRAPRTLSAQDFRDGALFVLQNLSVQGFRFVDLILVGLVSTATITADYAVAARLAAICELGRLALKPTFTPRARRHLRNGEQAELAREFHALRLGGFLAALVAAAGFAWLGRPILSLFGPYETAYGPLLVLSAVYVLAAGTGMHTTYLSMSGEVRWSAAIRALSVLVLAVTITLLAPAYGATGAAVGMLMVQMLATAASVALLGWRTGFQSVPPRSLATLAAAIALLAAAGAGVLAGAWAAGLLLAIAVLSVALEQPAWGDFVGLVSGRTGDA